MAHVITLPIQAPPDTVDVLVDFYDSQERDSLLASPMGTHLQGLPRTLRLPTPDLCAYYLYYKKRPGVDGYSSLDEIGRKWHLALVEFDGQIDFNNSSIRLFQAADTSTGTIERVGEAIGLCVSSQIHGLHQADWTRIRSTTKRRTLDFWYPWIAGDGRQFIQLETKGSGIPDNRHKPQTVSNHKASIKAKKAQTTPAECKSSVLYGTISVLDERPDSVARCWLVDPPADVPDNADRFKIVARLTYIANLISLISPRSTLAAALQSRVAAISSLTDLAELDGIRLRKGNGSEFSSTTFSTTGEHNPWFSGKSVVTDGPVGGQVVPVDKTCLLFIGIREELVAYAAEQDFAPIREYTFPAGTAEKVVACTVPKGRFRSSFSSAIDFSQVKLSDYGSYVGFTLRGHLYYTQSGFVLGVLPLS
jgi:hypothetical protein